MITISLPKGNTSEREYVVSVIFREFLNIDFKITSGIDNSSDKYVVELENGNLLNFEDHFFANYPNNLEYLDLFNLPSKIDVACNQFVPGENIPVIFGSSTCEVQQNAVTCGIDIFASVFFMLTRWEEHVNRKRDIHNRFPATESLAYKHGFLDRPITNEFIEMLWNMLKFLGIDQEKKADADQLVLTHDVDVLYMWKNWSRVCRVAIGDVLKRRNLLLALDRITEYYLIRRGKANDSLDTFDMLMDMSELVGVKSRFYFMTGGRTKFDSDYRIDETRALALIERINERNHIIGLHPSYDAYNDSKLIAEEKELLEQATGQTISEGREHYLRFEVPDTWQAWEDNNLKVDSTCGYADKVGYRCGTGDEFSVFNILTRKKLNLKERPLVAMDCSLFDYDSYSYEEALAKLRDMRKNTSTFTMLWHNSYVDHMKFYRNFIGSEL